MENKELEDGKMKGRGMLERSERKMVLDDKASEWEDGDEDEGEGREMLAVEGGIEKSQKAQRRQRKYMRQSRAAKES